MRFLHTFNQSLHHGNLPYGVRLMSWGLTLVNIPPMLFGLLFPFAWPVVLPGIFLWVGYLRMATDRLSLRMANLTWMMTIVFNVILIGLTFGTLELDGWWIAAFQALAVGQAGIALVLLRDAAEDMAAPDAPERAAEGEAIGEPVLDSVETNVDAGLPVHAWTA
ncbi:MAG: hypothetical protein D6722_01200 [Bacteroidetes bacterium]|nr:MAG: hypothetical protein D6722_01200 [Bacteroidota bacterium]